MATEVLGVEEAPNGVNVNGIMPGCVMTDMLKQFIKNDDE